MVKIRETGSGGIVNLVRATCNYETCRTKAGHPGVLARGGRIGSGFASEKRVREIREVVRTHDRAVHAGEETAEMRIHEVKPWW